MVRRFLVLWCMFLAISTYGFELKTKFADEKDLARWQYPKDKVTISAADGLTITSPDGIPNVFANLYLSKDKIAGQRIQITVEAKWDIAPASGWGGVMIFYQTNGQNKWVSTRLSFEKKSWETLVIQGEIPEDVNSCNLILGIQGASGKIQFRNLSVLTTKD